jgi:endonuclease YncB( thermonuclease family)
VTCVVAGCQPPAGSTGSLPQGRYDTSLVDRSLASDDAGLLLGTFAIAPKGVVDGDTLKVAGLDASLRLSGIDTEETFKSEKDRRLYETGWDNYLRTKATTAQRPIKVATPMGEEAKKWAAQFFKGVLRVRVERDHPGELRGRYNRFLAYVFVERDGQWINYNIEAVRAGMTPYFTKYGYSHRFHDEFVAAQREARAASLGIWDPTTQHFPDYDTRLQWWSARADYAKAFETRARGRDDHIMLSRWDALDRLTDNVGQEVAVLGTVADIRRSDRGPIRVYLSRKRFEDLPLIFFDEGVFEASGLSAYKGEYVVARGPVTTYRHPKAREDELQILVRRPEQIELPPYDPPASHIAASKESP